MKFTKKIKKEICSQYISRNMTISQIRKKYKIANYNIIYDILRANNVILRGNQLDVKIQKKIISLYKEGLTIKEIRKKIKVGKSTVIKYLKINKIKTRKPADNVKYKINLEIFSKVDSKEKAQFLGLIYSDGSLSSYNNTISTRLREDDFDYLENWRINFLKTDKSLYYVKPRKHMVSPLNNKKYKITKGTYILDIVSKKIYNDAIKLGLCPNKTKENIGMPKINKKYLQYFILGLFEGDGSIVKTKSSTSLTIACQDRMSKDLFNYLRSLKIKAYLYKREKINIIQISNMIDLKKIYDLFYKNNKKFVMRRKYEKFTKILQTNKRKR